MLLGAFVDAGMPIEHLKNSLLSLNLPGFDIKAEKVKKNGISATKVTVIVNEHHSHDRHVHHHRTLKDIENILTKSDIQQTIKYKSMKVYERLANAEAKVHSSDIQSVHFHEVGALDAVVDVLGSLIALDYFKIEMVYVSAIEVGSGQVETSHGVLPVPCPASVELLKGVPTESKGVRCETATPTGCAIVTSVADSFGKYPEMKILATGYGAGDSNIPELPNALRIFIGESSVNSADTTICFNSISPNDEMYMIETNVDDTSPEILGYLLNLLLEKGATDVYYTPVFMKKNRPGVQINVLSKASLKDSLAECLLSETTTLGIRISRVERLTLSREMIKVKTRFGELEVKVSSSANNKISKIAPEYEICAAIAREKGLPLQTVYQNIIEDAGKTL